MNLIKLYAFDAEIDYAEYIRRRYAEETDAMVVSLNRFNRDNCADGVPVPDLRDDGRVK